MTEDIDEIYRRASALDPSRPSEALRRKVLEHAAALTGAPLRRAANRARWRPAVFGTLAAASLAGLLIIPRVFSPHPPTELADSAAPAMVPPPSPPQAAAGSRAIAPADEPTAGPRPDVQSQPPAKPRTADASRLAASRLEGAAESRAAVSGNTAASAQPAAPPTDPSAALRRAAEAGDARKLRTILRAEVRIDAPDARGRTALMLAALNGRAQSVDVLLAHGADPNAADANGTTPLNAALSTDQPAIAAALRRAGAR